MAHSHDFAPTMPKQQKVSFDCSLPQGVSSIQKVTTALPYPTDISQALNFSAAYLDHSAYLAKHALHSFEHLQKAHSDLHAVAEGRLKTIANLESAKRTLEQTNRGLQSKYTELEKHHARDVEAFAAREAQLKKQLADALAALDASQGKVAVLEREISEDKLADIKRNQQYENHISADHLRIKQAVERATKAEAEIVKLKADIEATNKKLAVAEATIKTLQEQLTASEANASKLKKALEVETQAKLKLQADLDVATASLQQATIKIGTLESENAALGVVIKARDVTIGQIKVLMGKQDGVIARKDAEVDSLQKSWDDISARLSKKAAEVNENEEIYKAQLALKQEEIDALKVHPVQTVLPKVDLLKSKLTPTVTEVPVDIL